MNQPSSNDLRAYDGKKKSFTGLDRLTLVGLSRHVSATSSPLGGGYLVLQSPDNTDLVDTILFQVACDDGSIESVHRLHHTNEYNTEKALHNRLGRLKKKKWIALTSNVNAPFRLLFCYRRMSAHV